MPHVAMIGCQHHNPPRVTRQFQKGTQRTDPIDRPIVPNLFRTVQPVVDGIDDHADDPVVGRQNRLAQVITDNASGTFRDFLLVKQHRWVFLVADLPQRRMGLEVTLLVGRIASGQDARQQGRP